ncbi:hypothetical protein DWV00_06540 [Trinickia dinghuensis]|uniref:Uncharacterized protein n=1 Tax=Trinickia dinghuensis TaxID=2291023 RepID=A0A3D8K3L1_9BURK|nr:hypothetical protein DWV00_06540 [Trinickia dinghuensis]
MVEHILFELCRLRPIEPFDHVFDALRVGRMLFEEHRVDGLRNRMRGPLLMIGRPDRRINSG